MSEAPKAPETDEERVEFDGLKILNEHGGETEMENGLPAKIFSFHQGQKYCFVGELKAEDGVWVPANWDVNGNYMFGEAHPRNLTMPPEVVCDRLVLVEDDGHLNTPINQRMAAAFPHVAKFHLKVTKHNGKYSAECEVVEGGDGDE
jgi:hypothetical protein